MWQHKCDLITCTIDLGPLVGEYDCVVKYLYTPRQAGRYNGPPESCYPDEPESLEVCEVLLGETNLTVLLSKPLEQDSSFMDACRDNYYDMLAEHQMNLAGM
jgi:hypothetical protein